LPEVLEMNEGAKLSRSCVLSSTDAERLCFDLSECRSFSVAAVDVQRCADVTHDDRRRFQRLSCRLQSSRLLPGTSQLQLQL